KDKASALIATAGAEAEVIKFDNAAEAAGLAAQVAAFDGDGAALSRNMLLAKIAPSFRTILSSSEGPPMDLFREFSRRPESGRSSPSAGPPPRTTAGAPRADRPGPTSSQPRPSPADSSEEDQP